MALSGLGARELAERSEPFGCAAVRDDTVDRRYGRANARHLRLGLMAAPDHAKRPRIAARQVLRGHAARGSRPKGAEPVSLDHGHESGRLRVEETDDESGPFRRRGVQLGAGEAEPAVGGRHVGERTLWQTKAPARRDLDLPGG